MSDLCCRICLSLDDRLQSISNSPLKDVYEKIANMQLLTDDGKPTTVCYICHHQLRRSLKLMTKSQRANELLTNLLNQKSKLTQQTLVKDHGLLWNLKKTITNLGSVAVEKENDGSEYLKCDANIIKEEVNDDLDSEQLYSADSHKLESLSSSDEDDIPLVQIKGVRDTQKTKIALKKKNVRVQKNEVSQHRRINNKDIIPDAREIILSTEEQLANLQKRAKSLNYLNSPFKCDLCFKGFVDTRAFDNHKEKHEERSGVYECSICRMRYRTARQRDCHTLAAHSKEYHCNKCGHRSHTVNQAREHEKWHDGYTYNCQLCGHDFRKPTSYLTHMRKRHPTEHVCNICGECFVGSHGLLMHKTKAHKGKQKNDSDNVKADYKYCQECNIHFVSEDAWKRHILSSIKHSLNSDSRTSCLICGTAVPSGTLKSHLQEHEKSLPSRKRILTAKLNLAHVSCDLCGESFAHRCKLRVHIERVHLGRKYIKNVVCEICGKNCPTNASLKYHQRTHTGEKPFSCQQCSKRFSDKTQLKIHVRTHTGERPYSCVACGKRFTQKPALNRHFRVHTGVKPYDCKYCSKTFSQSNSLKAHVNTVHLKLPKKKNPNNGNTDSKVEKSGNTQEVLE